MTRQITQVKVWRDTTKKEVRIYVDFAGSKQSGCLYITGNHWHQANSLENMTADELKAAKKIAVKDGRWTTVWASDLEATQKPATTKAAPAPKTNKYECHCRACGQHLAVGEGTLVHLTDEEDIDFIGQGNQWITYCLDTEACAARRSQAQAEREAERKAEQERAEESRNLAASMTVEERREGILNALWSAFGD